jgi:hypothetical protein
MITFASIIPEFIHDLPTLAVLGIAWAAYALLGSFYLRGVRRVRLFF